MKNRYLWIVTLLSAFLFSCGKDLVYSLPDAEKYTNVYMIQAVDHPRTVNLYILEDLVQTTNYSAYYSGLAAPKDIHVKFKVDLSYIDKFNEQNQTNYPAMPEGSYELESEDAVIPQGGCNTKLMKIVFNTFGHIEPLDTYLLPVVMTTPDAPVNENLSVTYFQIKGAYAPGKIPRRLMLEKIGYTPVEMFSYNDKCLITRSGDGKLRRYGYIPGEDKLGSETVLATDWSQDFVHYIAAGGNNRMVLVNQYWTLITVPWNEDGTSIPNPADPELAIFTGGCGIFNMFISSYHPDGVMGRWGDGWLSFYPVTPDWKALDGGGVMNMVNWNIYDKIIVYNKDIIAIDSKGDMWLYKYSVSDYTFGNPTRIGSGWDMYTHIAPLGTDLYALDADGNLWQYQFSTKSFWALK